MRFKSKIQALFSDRLKKAYRIMKIAMLLSLIFSLQIIAGPSYSQSTRLTLNMNNAKVKDVLMQIENQSEFYFLYNGKLVDVEKKVNIEANNKSVQEVLAKVLDDDVSVKIVDRQIILLPSSMDTEPAKEITQGIVVTGTITDKRGDPMPGVNVFVKGTTTGVITDSNGKYSITVPNQSAELAFSFIGFITNEYVVGNQRVIDIILDEDTQEIEEVVVIGYGTAKKRDLTSAVSHVSSKDFLQVGAVDAAMQMQGKVAGVSVSNLGAGDPNSSTSIQVRGVSSRNAGLGPLIVVDGVPGGSNMENLNPDDIESIDILKDGAASAIYGTRGSNGVIMVTTKKGGSLDGSIKATYNGYVAWNFMKNELNVMTADEFKQYRVPTGKGTDMGYDTNWIDEIMQTGMTQRHSLALSSGNMNNNYRISVDYADTKGMDIRSRRKDYGARFSGVHKSKNGLYQVNMNVSPRIIYRDNANWGAFNQAITVNPTYSVFDPTDPTGQTYQQPAGWSDTNPVETVTRELDGSEDKRLNWSGSFQLNLLPVLAKSLKNHTLNTSLIAGGDISDGFEYFFRPMSSLVSIRDGYRGMATREYRKRLNQSYEWLINYAYDTEKHHLKLLGGYSYQYSQESHIEAENRDFQNDNLLYNSLGSGAYMSAVAGRTGFATSKDDSRLISFFGRVTYDYKQKYLFTASLRYEGSSKFGPNTKWGYFPAASVGWRISDESFMKGLTWLSDLKVRADVGVTGNQDFPSYQSLPTYTTSGRTYYQGGWMVGWNPERNPNLDLKWETATNWNLGVDFAFFNYRLSGSVNYYNRNQSDLLGSVDAPAPKYPYTTIYANVGSMTNQGVEIELTGRVVDRKDFGYSATLVMATNDNKFKSFSSNEFTAKNFLDVVSMPGPGTPGYIQRLQEGQRVGSFFTWRYAGVDATGNWLVYNRNGDAIPVAQATTDDKDFTGNGLPKFSLSMTHTFRYKNWDASVFLRGNFGHDLYNVQHFYLALQAAAADNANCLLEAYTDNAHITTGSNVITDYFIEKGSYLKIDVASIGYTFKFSSVWAESLRVYCSGKNLYTFTKFKGRDPDAYPVNGLYPGISTSVNTSGVTEGSKNFYPSSIQLLLGVQFNF